MVKLDSLEREPLAGQVTQAVAIESDCRVVVVWIDWYAYHVARFQGLVRHSDLAGHVTGIELVGGVGVHAGLKFREELPSSLPIKTLQPQGNWAQANKWKLGRDLWHTLNRMNPQAVLVPGYYTVPAIAAALWAKMHRRKSVLMTESTAHDHSRNRFREGIKKFLINNLFDWAVAGGKPHRRYLGQLGFPAERIVGFYDVVDNSFFHDRCDEIRASHIPSDFGLPAKYFLYVGRIAAEKSTDLLINEYVRYRVTGGTASLVLVGDGPQMTEIRTAAAITPYARDIYFPGLKGTSELPHYYAFASAFVLASTREPWGLVVNEAMASGLPVIVSKRCGCVEDLVVEGENGFTFDPSNGTALASFLFTFDNLTPEKRRSMGRRSFEIICRFSPDALAGEIARVLKAKP